MVHMGKDFIGRKAQKPPRCQGLRPPRQTTCPRKTASHPTGRAAGRSDRHQAWRIRIASAGTNSRNVTTGLGMAKGLAVGQHGGCEDGEARLEKFRGLQRKGAQIQFAPCPSRSAPMNNTRKEPIRAPAKVTAARNPDLAQVEQ